MKHGIRAAGVLVGFALASALSPQPADRDRGAEAVRGKPAMNPPVWSAKTYESLWKRWGVAERPANFPSAVRERYGLHVAPYDNAGLPMGLHFSKGLFGKGIVNDCLLCHAGVVADQTVIGVGNASLDLQSLFEDLLAIEKLPLKIPVRFGHGRGTIDPVNPATFLAQLRDADLNLQQAIDLDFSEYVNSDPPAWWLLKRKQTRNWTGGIRVNSLRVDMINLFSPLNSAAHIKKQQPVFADIHAFIMSVEAPKYPFAIDAALAERGRGLFNDTCARCHGTYGADAKYPNKIVALDVVGTDDKLAKALTRKNIDHFNKSWLGKEKAPDGSYYTFKATEGYQAPPLDGVWATAPYFHNGSVPTLAAVLDSTQRPAAWTRSYDSTDYDQAAIGWQWTAAPGHAMEANSRVYDTSEIGYGNGGHTYGDILEDTDRAALLEYLKTL
jgi:hypothetical protein